MKKMICSFLANTLLFRGIAPEEIPFIFECLHANIQEFEKDHVILREGDSTQEFGILLSGSVNIVNTNFWGDTVILDHIDPGQVFGETYACLPGEPLPISAVAAEPCQVLFLQAERIFQCCKTTCPYHARLIKNMLLVSARKNMTLSRRIFHTSPKTIRGRLLSYLSFQASKNGTLRFEIPFNRQQLADYLGVDRSALSNEMGKMQKEGLISFRKNEFEIHRPDSLF